MPVLKLDKRRRITLPKSVAGDAKQKFLGINIGRDIVLKPLPKDLTAELEKSGKRTRKVLLKSDLERMGY